MNLIEYCKDRPIGEILLLPDVKDRVYLYIEHEDLFKEQLRRCTTLHQNLAVIDLRAEEVIYCGNRFMVYALFPECNISMHVMPGMRNQNTVFAVGKSIFNRTSKTDVGQLMLKYGGGGHANAGTCQVENEWADAVMRDVISQINADG
jgi:nanoRNase/pAp phosphatase (c-di-AMP/oligoRNAs hydrolase)